MQSIGLTGGIGSGKSTIARILKTMGFPVYIADTEASRLIDTDPDIRREMQTHFGNSIYTANGPLDKVRLAGIIFENPEALKQVNSIVHPKVIKDFQQWSLIQQKHPVFFESAILYEARLESFFDAVICVTAPQEVRLQRVIQRDRTDREKVGKRMANQLDDSQKCRRSDFIIYNDDQHMVIEQILSLLNKL